MVKVMRNALSALILIIALSLILVGCGEEKPEGEAGAEGVSIRLATTTSTEDSGFLNELLPIFEDETGHEVSVVAVGTGQALQIARSGDADVLMVHAPELEQKFVEAGYGTERYDVMYNDFLIVGPNEDPAGAYDLDSLEEVLEAISAGGEEGKATFASRGDESGTHAKEVSLWEEFEIDYEGHEWYDSLGQGMGDTLITANEMEAYALVDRGTYLSMVNKVEDLKVVSEGDELLNNPYGIIPLNPDEFEHVEYKAAKDMVDFFTRDDIQEKISEFGIDEYGEPLFFPVSE